MKTYTGTVVVRYYQELTVQAESAEEAEMKMYEQFNLSGAVSSECQAYDVEEVRDSLTN